MQHIQYFTDVTTLWRSLHHMELDRIARERERELQAALDTSEQRSKLMSFVKQIVTQSMVSNGTCKMGPMLSTEFNDELDRTPVFGKFMKSLEQHQRASLANRAKSTQPDSLTLLRNAKLRFGYYRSQQCASIMEHGFDPTYVYGQGDDINIDLSIPPSFADATQQHSSDDDDSGIVGCLVIDDPWRVRELSHGQALVVDNSTESSCVEIPTFCLPVVLIARDVSSIMARVHVSLHYQDAVRSLAMTKEEEFPPHPIHDIEYRTNDGTWASMTPSISAFLKENFNHGILISTFRVDGYRYEVDLWRMKQTNLFSETVRDLRIVSTAKM